MQKSKQLIKTLIIFNLISLLVSCSKIETKDPEEAYQYWSGNNPPKEIKLIKGEYYQSPHFTLEYELFLKFKSEEKWFNEFVKYNNLEIDTIKNDWSKETDCSRNYSKKKSFLKTIICSRFPNLCL